MAALVRFLILYIFLLPFGIYGALASTEVAASGVVSSSSRHLVSRKVITENNGGNVTVVDPATQKEVPQTSASDGSGTGFDVPAIIWIGFSFAAGVPLALGGVRLWKITLALSLGLASAVCAYAAIINTLSSPGIPDLLLTFTVLGFFVGAGALGFFNFARVAGIVILGLSGGAAFGIRIVIIKEQLLISSIFALNWAIVALSAVVGGAIVLFKQRAGICLGAASAGSFLSALGVDLILNKQSGMSRGLRFLFDRNSSHLSDLLTNGYDPPRMTMIIIAASLGAVPVLAFAQHKIFRHPFTRHIDERNSLSFPTDTESKPSSIESRFSV